MGYLLDITPTLRWLADPATWGYFFLYFVVFMFALYTALFIASMPAILKRYLERSSEDVYGILTSNSLPPIAFVVPAYNESKNILFTVKTLLKLSYRYKQVLVVNDGSTDNTLDILIQHFDLVKVPPSSRGKIPTMPIRAYYKSLSYPELIVVDKENGRKGDALNAALNVCTSPIYVSLDADSLLDDKGLIYLVRPFLESDKTLAVHSNVCLANGCEIADNRIVKYGFPNKLITGFQLIEYLRTTFIDKMSFNNYTRGALIIPGAFGMYKTEAVREIGGYDANSIVEDMEMTIRLHKFNLEAKRDYAITFIPENISWTEAPETISALNKQRRRWYGGTTECMFQYKYMFLNPKYKSIGMVVFPYYMFDKLCPPTIEALGTLLLLLGLFFGKVNIELLLLMGLACWIYATFLTCICILAQEKTFRMYPSIKDMIWMVVCAVLENISYHYLLLYWKLRGLFFVKNPHHQWHVTPRAGYDKIKR